MPRAQKCGEWVERGVQMKLASVLQTDQTNTDTYMIHIWLYDTHTHTHTEIKIEHTQDTPTRIRLMAYGKWNVIYILRDIHAQWSGLGLSRMHRTEQNRTEQNITEKKLMAYYVYGIISKRHTIVRGISTKSLIGLVGETIGGWLRLVWALSGWYWYYLRVYDPLSWLMAHLVGCVTGMLLKVPANLGSEERERKEEHISW